MGIGESALVIYRLVNFFDFGIDGIFGGGFSFLDNFALVNYCLILYYRCL